MSTVTTLPVVAVPVANIKVRLAYSSLVMVLASQ
jgi:hypothetical protein